jgi:hypothetical protein
MDTPDLLRDLSLALASYRSHLDEMGQGLLPATPHDPGSSLKPWVDRRAVEWLLGVLGPDAPAEARARAAALDTEFEAFQRERTDYWPRLRADLETLAEVFAARGVAVALLSSGAELLNVLAERTYIEILREVLEPRGLVSPSLRDALAAEEAPFRAFVERHRAAGLALPSVEYAPARYWWLRPPERAGTQKGPTRPR